MLYVRQDIPSNLLAFEDKPIKSLFIKLTLLNTKTLTNCLYNLHKSEIKNNLTALRNSLGFKSMKYEKILIFGYFNVEIEEVTMKSFCENHKLKHLIR